MFSIDEKFVTLTEVSGTFAKNGVEAEPHDASLSVPNWLTDSKSTFAPAPAPLDPSRPIGWCGYATCAASPIHPGESPHDVHMTPIWQRQR